jgi:hypothetical protein
MYKINIKKWLLAGIPVFLLVQCHGPAKEASSEVIDSAGQLELYQTDTTYMDQEIKDEALEQLELDVKFGFDDEATIFTGIREMFYDETDFDESWLERVISEKFSQHQQESLTWSRPTDFEKIAKAFDDLIAQKIVCLHKAGYTRQDGEDDCMGVVEELRSNNVQAIGYCFYHEQDLARVVDPEGGGLLLGYNSASYNDKEALMVANKIVEAMKKQGFEVAWNGSLDQRIEVKNVHWQKVPDGEDWGADRVMQILVK